MRLCSPSQIRPSESGFRDVPQLGDRRAGSSITEFFISGRSLLWWPAGIISVYSTLFGVGQLIFGATVRGILLLFVAVVCFWWIGRNLRPSCSSRGPVPGVAS
jgi:hypothetical protein